MYSICLHVTFEIRLIKFAAFVQNLSLLPSKIKRALELRRLPFNTEIELHFAKRRIVGFLCQLVTVFWTFDYFAQGSKARLDSSSPSHFHVIILTITQVRNDCGYITCKKLTCNF